MLLPYLLFNFLSGNDIIVILALLQIKAVTTDIYLYYCDNDNHRVYREYYCSYYHSIVFVLATRLNIIHYYRLFCVFMVLIDAVIIVVIILFNMSRILS